MHSSGTNSRTKCRWNIPGAEPRFGSTKLAVVAIRAALMLAMIFVLLLIATHPAQAQTETVLYNFSGGCGGPVWPTSSLIFDSSGNLYGTTNDTGCGPQEGVFELSPNGSGGWNLTVLQTLGVTGYLPSQFSDLILDKQGNLYGTVTEGGAYGYGFVFELSPGGTGWTETDLYDFTGGSDGGYPEYGATMDAEGNLWVTTDSPSTLDELSPSGAGWTEQTIGSGAYWGRVAFDAAGNIFCSGYGDVVELTPNGSGGWTQTAIWFPPGNTFVNGFLAFDTAGNLYVTTIYGGAHCVRGGGCGAVYKLSLGQDGWTAEILYSFKGGKKDGAGPWSGVVLDAAGNIYGTTGVGGSSSMGTVYELLAPVRAGSYTEKVLWAFNGADGATPYDTPILDSAGNLYGTAEVGGSGGYGVVFEISGVPVTTTTTLTSSPNPSTYGQPVTFTAVVTPGPPDGETVKFEHGKTVLGTGSLSGGSASFTTSTLPMGSTKVTAVYGGDLNLLGSTSNAVNQVVKKAGK